MHLILEKAKRYDLPIVVETPTGFEYDKASGLWRDVTSGEPYVTCNGVKRPATKKHDVETGEDQKGE